MTNKQLMKLTKAEIIKLYEGSFEEAQLANLDKERLDFALRLKRDQLLKLKRQIINAGFEIKTKVRPSSVMLRKFETVEPGSKLKITGLFNKESILYELVIGELDV